MIGSGTMTIVSDDPDEPEVVVPLTATPDMPPSLIVETPVDGEVLSPGVVTSFRAWVLDDSDDPESMLLEWRDGDGALLADGFADESGLGIYEWNAAERTSGDNAVTVSVTDSCGHTVEETVNFCQNAGYTEDSIDLESWQFRGDARWDADAGWVELTRSEFDQAGTAFQTSESVSSDDIVIEFDFYVSGGTGADGISLTALDADRHTTFVGAMGGGIGYAGLPGWSIEVDTWYNNEGYTDPTMEDHVSFHLDGDINSPSAWAEIPDMEDDLWHRALVEVVGDHVRVSIDGVLYIDETIAGLEPFNAYVGFTGATGGHTNYHWIDALEVEGFICED